MRIWIYALALSLAGLGGCLRDNPVYCDDAHPCAAGSCSLDVHRCTGSDPNDLSVPLDLGGAPDGNVDGDLGPCACSGTTPLCQAGQCLACASAGDGEAACAQLSAAAPHCLTSGTGVGACVGCRDGSDCAADKQKAICDAATHTCRGCSSDGECASKVCDLTPGSQTLYQCLTTVVYVDKSAPPGGDGSTPAKALQSVMMGVAKAMQANIQVVHIAQVNGFYDQDNLSLNNVNVTLVGETGAAIRPNGNNNPALELKGNSTVVVRNLIFTGATGNTGAGITCSATSLTVLQSTVHSNAQYGIDANNCGVTVVDRSYIGATPTGSTNSAGGIRVGGAYRISNNFIVKNGLGGAASGGGISINSPSTFTPQQIVGNTIVGNGGSGPGAGVNCPIATSAVLAGNIFYANLSGVTVSETNDCTVGYACTDDPIDAVKSTNVSLVGGTPGFLSVSDYHLAANSPCKDKGPPANAYPAYDYDGQVRPDPASNKTDIGADEVQ